MAIVFYIIGEDRGEKYNQKEACKQYDQSDYSI